MALLSSFVATQKRKWANKKLDTSLAKVGPNGNPVGGGCCIWYDEPALLTDVEKRLGKPIEVLPPDLRPPNLKPGQDPASLYGELAAGPNKEDRYTFHVEELAPTVAELKQLETAAQQSFFELRQRFS
eukprot:SAG31_NODE_3531_length_4151_cov_2.125864_3_plen_128_part_00